MTESDLEIIEFIRRFVRRNHLNKIDNKMEIDKFIADMLGINNKTYAGYKNNKECTKCIVNFNSIIHFISFMNKKFPDYEKLTDALGFELIQKELEISTGKRIDDFQSAHASHTERHGPISFTLVDTPPVFIFTNSDDVLQNMLSLVFESENKVKDICMVVNDFTMDTVRAIQKYKELAKSENLKIDGMNLNLYRSKNTIFYNIVASQSDDEFFGLLFNENEYVELSEIGRYLICQEMNLDNFEHIGSESSIKFFNHFN
jgi:hypothetical protein